jgi:hypothetical protein
MLSEIFILRLEAILRASSAAAPDPGHTRFVPIAPPVSLAEDLREPGNPADRRFSRRAITARDDSARSSVG